MGQLSWFKGKPVVKKSAVGGKKLQKLGCKYEKGILCIFNIMIRVYELVKL